jgi:hypothetical protein
MRGEYHIEMAHYNRNASYPLIAGGQQLALRLGFFRFPYSFILAT